MKSVIIIVSFLFFSSIVHSQTVPVIKIEDLLQRITNDSDTTYIVNFWATWCAPCIKELPDFDSITSTYRNQKIKVLLVSLDFKEDLKTKLLPFIQDKPLKSEVLLLDELNGNYFIPKISGNWSGALPATLIVNNKNKTKLFFEKKTSKIDTVKIQMLQAETPPPGVGRQ